MPTCKKCGAKIHWVPTKGGKWMPCDADLIEYKAGSTPDYEDVIVTETGDVLRCTFDFQCDPDGRGYLPHWASCPSAAEFRRRRAFEEGVIGKI